MAQHEPAQGPQLARHRRRRDDVAEAKAGRENLGEAADIDDAPVIVEAAQRRRAMAFARQLRLVAVLDDHHVVVARHFTAPRGVPRHGDGRRALMGWRHIDIFAAGHLVAGNEAVRVDGERHTFR